MAGSIRHMILSLPTLIDIFPSIINVMPLNIFFSSTFGMVASASLTRLVSPSLIAIINKFQGYTSYIHSNFLFNQPMMAKRISEVSLPVTVFIILRSTYQSGACRNSTVNDSIYIIHKNSDDDGITTCRFRAQVQLLYRLLPNMEHSSFK